LKKILYLEDDPDYRERVEYLLRDNYQIIIVETLGEAFDTLKSFNDKKNKIDMIILDVMMPVEEDLIDVNTSKGGLINGIVFYKKIKESIYKGNPPKTLFFSGQGAEIEIEADEILGPDCPEIIFKRDIPPDLNELIQLIHLRIS
jgi:CheY-like chemotaxis protein